ncbi:MAG: Glycoside hydrolase [Promethearchaeota archaeon]|nr:MAG: Glycoside hydrolase [Candidatus Lokiarchaeota archaeon]
MPRSIVFGNQQMLVCFDSDYTIRDIYHPHVGLENHLNGHKCRIGIWVKGKFSWLEEEQWDKEIKYHEQSLVGNSVFNNQKLSTKLIIKDCVYPRKNIFVREITIYNISEQEKEYRFFFSHDVQIYGTQIGITAYYEPDSNGIIHYLNDRWFLFRGRGDNKDLDGFATGRAHFGDSLGTYKDAEDGELSGNPIDQGTFDYTLQINLKVGGCNKSSGQYWFCIGHDHNEVDDLNEYIRDVGISKAINET